MRDLPTMKWAVGTVVGPYVKKHSLRDHEWSLHNRIIDLRGSTNIKKHPDESIIENLPDDSAEFIL